MRADECSLSYPNVFKSMDVTGRVPSQYLCLELSSGCQENTATIRVGDYRNSYLTALSPRPL